MSNSSTHLENLAWYRLLKVLWFSFFVVTQLILFVVFLENFEPKQKYFSSKNGKEFNLEEAGKMLKDANPEKFNAYSNTELINYYVNANLNNGKIIEKTNIFTRDNLILVLILFLPTVVFIFLKNTFLYIVLGNKK